MTVAQTLASVLIVEEHAEMRAALRDWLTSSLPPLRLGQARTMEEALQITQEMAFDVALVNVELRGSNGIEAARELRRRYPECAVIVMSVHDSEALRLAAIDAGAHAFVSKRELTTTLLPILRRLVRS